MVFFKENWDLTKGDLEGVFKEFFERGIPNSPMFETLEWLIPKKENANRVKEFRLISLITSVYKILAKVLANRLRTAVPSTISDQLCKQKSSVSTKLKSTTSFRKASSIGCQLGMKIPVFSQMQRKEKTLYMN